MILKACNGNRSLGWDLLPPGSERYELDGKVYAGYKDSPDSWAKGTEPQPIDWYAGKQYDFDVADVKKVLADIGKYYPNAAKFEIAGFFFWEGEKDAANAGHSIKYEENLVRLILQLRKEFNSPNAKFVLATMGDITTESGGNRGKILNAQLVVDGSSGKYPEFKGNVATVYSHPLSLGGSSSGGTPYNGNAETYMNVGEAMGQAMTKLLKEAKPAAPPLAVAPFDATQAKAHQAAWAKHLGIEVETTNSVGAKMVLIPPGEFMMGSTNEQVEAALKVADEIGADQLTKDRIQKNERPQHKVVITKSFLMSATEVTVGQFKRFAAATGYQTEAEKAAESQTYLNPGYAVTDDSPAAVISWNDAVAYCDWLSTLEKTSYRLPTEAEWEYACRAGTTTQYSFGDELQQLEHYGWYNKNAISRSHAVGTKQPNNFGLADMHGNVTEWCSDFYDEKWYATSPSNDPKGPSSSSTRVIRGGNWHTYASNCRSASRPFNTLSNRVNHLGFRCVRTLEMPTTTAIASTPPIVAPVPKPTGTAPTPAVAPFDAARAKAHQQAWAKHLGTDVVQPNSIGMQMTLIPPGEFLMGSSDADITLALKIAEETKLDERAVKLIQDERPQHTLRITKPFRLAAHEVTIGQFAKFVEQTKYKTQAEEFGGNSDNVKPEDVKPDSLKLTWRTPGYAVTDDSPVTLVSWNDAVAFFNWLSGQEQLTPCYQRDGDSWTLLPKANGYRLPTEAEWEYSCRAGTTTQYSFGNDWQDHDKYGWSNKNAGNGPHAVGLLPANPFGLYDMHGNVWEWCQDWYDGKWYEKSPSDDPFGPGRSLNRVARGGCWRSLPANSRSSFRNGINPPSTRYQDRGFRPVLSSVGAPSSTASVTPQPSVPAAASTTKLFMHDPAFPQWMKDVQAMSAEKQIEAVSKKLVELNPGFDGKLTGWDQSATPRIENGIVTELGFSTNNVSDISPVRALTGMKSLSCPGSGRGKGRLSDLLPLQGMTLRKLNCGYTTVLDFSPLRGMPLLYLGCFSTELSDLSPLVDCQSLEVLGVPGTKVTVADVTALQKALPKCKIEWDNPAKATPPEQPSTPIQWTNLKIAVWVIEHGGTLWIGDKQNISKREDLPPGEIQSITLVTFKNTQQIGDNEAALMAQWSAIPGMVLENTKVTDAGLRMLASLKLGGSLSAIGESITGEGFEAFAGKPIGTIVVTRAQFSPKGWQALAQIGLTKIWYVTHSNFDDDACQEIVRRHPEIEAFHANETRVTDRSLLTLADQKNLRRLHLAGTKISDGGLAALKRSAGLTLLTITGTKVTPAGVAALQKALPNCKIEWDDPAKPAAPSGTK